MREFDSELVQATALSEEERHIEALCDEERYLELNSDILEKMLYEGQCCWRRILISDVIIDLFVNPDIES